MAAAFQANAFENTAFEVSAVVNGNATPAGVSFSYSLGTVVATGDAIAAPAGVSMSFSVGAASSTGDANATPAGVSMVYSVGSFITPNTNYDFQLLSIGLGVGIW